MSLLVCNFVLDAIRITRKDSPVAAVIGLDHGLSIDQEDEDQPFSVEGSEEEKNPGESSLRQR